MFDRTEHQILLKEINQRGHDHFAKWHPVPLEQRTVTVIESVLPVTGESFWDWYIDTFQCSNCGKYPKFEYSLGTHQATTPCEFADGAVYGATIQVPSGKMVIANSLFKFYPEAHDLVRGTKRISVNDIAGRKEYTEVLGNEFNLAYGCTYSSPNVYLDEETGTRLMVGGSRYDQDADEDIHPEGWRLIANVTTDLWAYTIADYDDFIAHGGSAEAIAESGNMTVVDVPAGAWEFTYLGDRPGWEAEENEDPEDADDQPVLIALAEFKPATTEGEDL